MRQAGRYMAEYRRLRERHSLLDICRSPDLATEVTLQPVRRIDVDAAILFSDLLLPLEPLGLPFDFVRGEGPQVERPIDGPADVDRLRPFEPREELAHVLETIRQVRIELDGRVPLIGFAGAPFTLASYAIEGGHSTNFAKTKALMYGHPDVWHRLCRLLATVVADYLIAQVEAGVDALQIFDSWVGTLGRSDYREFVLPHSARLFEAVGSRVPVVHFGTGTTAILEDLREAGGDVIGVDWRIGIDEAWARIGTDRAVQGNLDPTVLLGPVHRMVERADDILLRVAGRPGHVFNLGHGILPATSLEHVQMLAEHVHSATRRLAPVLSG
jgi:uroporphyrinogen decarboxylase